MRHPPVLPQPFQPFRPGAGWGGVRVGSQQGDARSGAGARPGPAGCERAPPRRPLGLGRRLRERAPPRYGPCCGAKPAAAAAGSQAGPELHVRLARHHGSAAPAGGGRSRGRARRAAERGRSASPSYLRSGQVARHAPSPEPGATRTHACLSSRLVLNRRRLCAGYRGLIGTRAASATSPHRELLQRQATLGETLGSSVEGAGRHAAEPAAAHPRLDRPV